MAKFPKQVYVSTWDALDFGAEKLSDMSCDAGEDVAIYELKSVGVLQTGFSLKPKKTKKK